MSYRITYPPQLPVSERREEIARAIRDNQVVVVAGETGSGKTTQLPKICLELGLAETGRIGHTQPRRLAARSVADRIADELNVALGQEVGYQVRFTDHSSDATRIKLMTDGILLAEIQRDRQLKQYSTIIIDEAHERSLNIDFLMGYLSRLLPKRPDLKVIITSATIDVDKFSRHFRDAPVISVSGRSYPVEIVYQDPAEKDEDETAHDSTASNNTSSGRGQATDTSDDDPLLSGVMTALRSIRQHERQQRSGPGDVLVFLSGERDIRELALSLRKKQLPDTEILPLYARLSAKEQQRIFADHRGRRIVLATNLAETSLTVPGIRYVIDSGLARISRYSVQSKVQRLPIEPVSQASANQRAGRCGRVAPGICYRLYSEDDFTSRPAFTDPEIMRTNLSAVILQMQLLRLGDIYQFPFIDPPERRAVNDGYRLLQELGALDENRRINNKGRQMARMPVDPRLAAMLIEANQRACLAEMLVIVSALSVQDPKDTPADKRDAAREQHRKYRHPESDFLSWLLLWNEVEKQRQDLSQNHFRKFCKSTFLSWLRLREWRETHRQLLLSCQQNGMKASRNTEWDEESIKGLYESIHRSILAGSLNQLGQKLKDGQYLGSRGRKFSIFPASGLFKKLPKWIVSAELIETSRLFATQAARIEPEWAEQAGQHLIKREYFEAHWSRRRGEVMAYERVTLFGLRLVEKRRVSYSSIDPVAARTLFIREGLLTGEVNLKAPFYRHNQRLIAEIRAQEEKERRPDILVSEDQLFAFYDQRMPVNITGQAALERWSRQHKTPRQTELHMQKTDVQAREISEETQRAFPDRAAVHHNQLKLNYRFDPGQQDDGVSMTVPLALLPQLTQEDIDWSVPGLLKERCIAIVKSLPKGERKKLVPVPEFVQQALANVKVADKPPLLVLLREQAKRLRNVDLPPDAWQESAVPEHLKPTIKLLGEDGKLLKASQDLKALKQQFSQETASHQQNMPRHDLERTGIKDWDFGDLPASVTMEYGITFVRYPAIRDDGDSVSVVLMETQSKADQVTAKGLARLYALRTPQQRQMISKQFASVAKALGLKLIAQASDWQEHALISCYRLQFETSTQVPRDRQSFESRLSRGRAGLVDTAERLGRILKNSIDQRFAIRGKLRDLTARFPESVADVEAQLAYLFPDDFPQGVPEHSLSQYPRYLKAIEARLEKLPAQSEKDVMSAKSVSALYRDWLKQGGAGNDALSDFGWRLQELRVSLFAQQLGTQYPVSEKRLQKRLEAAQSGDIHA
jgi:ATP-dependent helicase HrpA